MPSLNSCDLSPRSQPHVGPVYLLNMGVLHGEGSAVRLPIDLLVNDPFFPLGCFCELNLAPEYPQCLRVSCLSGLIGP